MTVNPFWLGFLLGIVSLIVLSVIINIFSSKDEQVREYNLTKEQFDALYKEMTGHDYIIGEAVEDPDDDDCK